MTTLSRQLLQKFRDLREAAGVSTNDLEKKLILGPGWVQRFETGATAPSIDTLAAMLGAIGKSFDDLLVTGSGASPQASMARHVAAEARGQDLAIAFPYGEFDAEYVLSNASIAEFESVVRELRDGLARLAAVGVDGQSEAIKTESVARCFLAAAKTWPHANPSDLWWFLVSRAYCDPFNHPARNARLDLGQSWKRTGGWALEEVVVRHYGPFLATKGVNLFIATGTRKEKLLSQLKIDGRLEADKVDVLLTYGSGSTERCFGVVHVKASFAERRSDDVPLSEALVKKGYTSPLWTMDCKGMPSARPRNRGELGVALSGLKDERSAKRKDIEDSAFFSNCFSYNANTVPTPAAQNARFRILVCDFKNPDDTFSKFIINEQARFSQGPAQTV